MLGSGIAEDALIWGTLQDPPLAFVECDRDSDQLTQLRTQLHDETGLAAPMITAEFEVSTKIRSQKNSAPSCCTFPTQRCAGGVDGWEPACATAPAVLPVVWSCCAEP